MSKGLRWFFPCLYHPAPLASGQRGNGNAGVANHTARCTSTNVTSLFVRQRQIQDNHAASSTSADATSLFVRQRQIRRQRQPFSQMHTNQYYIIVCQTKTNTKTKTKTTMQPAAHQLTLHHCLSDKDKYTDKDKDTHTVRCTSTDVTSLFVRQRQRQRQPYSQLHIDRRCITVCQHHTCFFVIFLHATKY